MRSTAARSPTRTTARTRAARRSTPPSPRRLATCSSRSSVQLRAASSPRTCVNAAVDSVEADYAAALDAIRDGPREAARRRRRTGRGGRHRRPAGRRRCGRAARRRTPTTTEGTAPGDLPLPLGVPRSPSLPDWASVDAVRAARRLPVPPRSAARRDRPALHRGLQRDQAPRRRRRHDAERTHCPTQTEIALFWYESSPLQWNRIARTVAAAARLDRVGAGAPVRPAQHRPDGRLHRHVRRPSTSTTTGGRSPRSGSADTDGNPATGRRSRVDAARCRRPPIPDYDSGHAVEGGAAAAVLRRFFRRDRVALQRLQHDAAGPGSKCDEAARRFRTYRSFSQAARGERASRASSSASTSARPWTWASSTDAGSATTRSTAPCGRPAASPPARPAALVPARARPRRRGACRRAGRRRRRRSPSRGRAAGRARRRAAPRAAARRGSTASPSAPRRRAGAHGVVRAARAERRGLPLASRFDDRLRVAGAVGGVEALHERLGVPARLLVGGEVGVHPLGRVAEQLLDVAGRDRAAASSGPRGCGRSSR